MKRLSFPDVNVWPALATSEHVHSALAWAWWQAESGDIAFGRVSQLGFLRLLTTAAVMDNKPLTMRQAWSVYDRFFQDERVRWLPEPAEVDRQFRQRTELQQALPKMWADAWMLAMAEAAGGIAVACDPALARRGAHCLLDRATP